jgi:hypothetical protein
MKSDELENCEWLKQKVHLPLFAFPKANASDMINDVWQIVLPFVAQTETDKTTKSVHF